MFAELAHTIVPGDTDTLVFLGSLGSDRSMWQPQVDAFAHTDGPTMITVDLRGHGGSHAPSAPYEIADLGGDVLALLDRLPAQRVHLIGLSLGGAVAQWIAAHHPERLHTLSLLCTAAKFGAPGNWFDRATFVRERGTRGVANSVVSRWFTDEFAAEHPEIVTRCRAMVTATDDEAYAACCEALARWDGRGDLARIATPTLVIAGAEDPATPPVVLAEIADGIPDARLVVLDQAAHLPTLERPAELAELLANHHRAAAL